MIRRGNSWLAEAVEEREKVRHVTDRHKALARGGLKEKREGEREPEREPERRELQLVAVKVLVVKSC